MFFIWPVIHEKHPNRNYDMLKENPSLHILAKDEHGYWSNEVSWKLLCLIGVEWRYRLYYVDSVSGLDLH